MAFSAASIADLGVEATLGGYSYALETSAHAAISLHIGTLDMWRTSVVLSAFDNVSGVIVWLNGTFGVGKSTTSRDLVARWSGSRVFDPEWVGYMLANNLADHPVADFQEYASWRRLVPVVADEIAKATDQHLVAVQTVLVEEYWREIERGFKALGRQVLHVVLDADADTLHERIDTDDQEPEHIRPWRHRHVDAYQAALGWLRPSADFMVDTVTLDAPGAAELIHAWAAGLPESGLPHRSR